MESPGAHQDRIPALAPDQAPALGRDWESAAAVSVVEDLRA